MRGKQRPFQTHGAQIFSLFDLESRGTPGSRSLESSAGLAVAPDDLALTPVAVNSVLPVQAAAPHLSSMHLFRPVVSKPRGVKSVEPGRQLWKKSGD